MNNPEFDKIVAEIAENDIFSDKEYRFSTEQLEFLKENPALLVQLSEDRIIKKQYIYLLFLLSIAMMVGSKIVEYTECFDFNHILQDIFSNVLFSISMEFFGAITITYFLEIVLESRKEKNKKLIQKLLDSNE